MSIISQESWEKFTEEEKETIRSIYLDFRNDNADDGRVFLTSEYEELFGKENLQPKPMTPKTWKDVVNHYEDICQKACSLDMSLAKLFPSTTDNKLRCKLKSTYAISKLIELGYGGMVSDEDWKNLDLPKYIIIPCNVKDELRIDMVYTRNDKQFAAFHSQELAEEFMSYPENVKLVEQYYMI